MDAMGGDHAPGAAIQGALRAVEKGFVQPDELILVGEASALDAERAAHPGLEQIEVVDAPHVLEPGMSPVEATRSKPRNSIAVSVELVKEGRAGAVVSAGSTGLLVATATLELRRLQGIRRPGIACTINGQKGPVVICDVGANPQPRARDLLDYALMGSAYHHDAYGTERPRVGIMNIGSEDEKGNPLIREANSLLKDCDGNYNFVGNVEGVDIFGGACDVVVCDGFTGNVLLKSAEGVAEYMLGSFARLMAENGVADATRQQVLQQMIKEVDYSEYGGALLLGVNGIVTISHGRSQAPAIANAIRVAAQAVGARVNEHIVNAAKTAAAG